MSYQKPILNDVWQSKASATRHPDYFEAVAFPKAYGTQLRVFVDQWMVGYNKEGRGHYIFRAEIGLGFRFVTEEAYAESERFSEGESDHTKNSLNEFLEENTLAVIESHFIAEYFSREEVSETQADALASQDALYHIWPIWNEFLLGQLYRMGLPRKQIPVVPPDAPDNRKVKSTSRILKGVTAGKSQLGLAKSKVGRKKATKKKASKKKGGRQ